MVLNKSTFILNNSGGRNLHDIVYHSDAIKGRKNTHPAERRYITNKI